jgi:arginase
MQDALTLLNESWLGAAMPKKHLPALVAVANRLNPSDKLQFRCIVPDGSVNRQNGIDYYDDIIAQIVKVGAALKEKQPVRLRNLGCDCGTDFAPIAHLLSRYRENLVVVWLDAHADLNMPASSTGGSPSGHFHGMVLRALTGHAAFGLSDHLRPPMLPSQIILAGAREIDPEEHDYIVSETVTLVLSEDLGQSTWLVALDASAALGINNAYIHIDFDVLNPKEFPWVGCPAQGGISIETLRQAVAQVYDRFDVRGVSAVGISAEGENAIRAANIVKELIA